MGSRVSQLSIGLAGLAIIGFLGFVGQIWIESLTGGTDGGAGVLGPDTPEAVDGASAVTQRALSVHLPLDGSEEADAAEGSACERLEGFLLDAAFHLEQEDAPPPMSAEEIAALVAGQRCALTDPEVAAVLDRFGAVWRETSLPPVGPFSRKPGLRPAH